MVNPYKQFGSHEAQIAHSSWQEGHDAGAQASKALVEALADALEAFTDDEKCEFDHHGCCQTHGVTKPCANETAKAALKLVGRIK